MDEGGAESGDGTFKSPRVRARGQEEDGGRVLMIGLSSL